MTLTVLLRIKFRKRIPKSKVDFFSQYSFKLFSFRSVNVLYSIRDIYKPDINPYYSKLLISMT